jgi:hypothetical protein
MLSPWGPPLDTDAPFPEVRKTPLRATIKVKLITLPRQARDKRRESNLKKDDRFSSSHAQEYRMDGVGQAIFNWMSGYPETDHAPDRCGKNAFSERHLQR